MGAEKRPRIGFEEAGNAMGHGRPGRQRIGDAGPGGERAPQGLALHAVPELPELVEAIPGGIAGDDARVDRSDRGADDPIGLDFRLVQGLVDAALIGAERAAALQDEHDLPVRLLADHVDGVERRSIP